MENLIKIDDLGVPLFLETPKLHQVVFWGILILQLQQPKVCLFN